jgi:hypothetical protein
LDSAELTFRIGRHALADLWLAFSPKLSARDAQVSSRTRLTPEGLKQLRALLENSGLHSEDSPESAARLERLRASYEWYAIAISRQLMLPLPDWLPPEDVREYWRVHPLERPGEELLP